ncbi:MAG: choice-of-anchor D domain-containing protein [Longimicrobiaceae bacterium]
MPSPDLTAAIQAEIRGNVSGQVAVGTHILQIGDVHGGVVNVALPEQRPVPRPRAAPVLLRPRPFPGFLGRDDEVESAVAALRSARPVQLSGPPGAGKTSLLRHLAHHAVTADFPGGVAFLSALRQGADDLLQSLFEALFQADAPLKPTRTELSLLLQGWQALVVLDDVELPREEVERIQNTAPGCTFLWSAPERQGWGEVRALPLAGLSAAEARALVERELERPLDAAEQAELDALCEATGGYPLPLLQSAARVREDGVSLHDVVERLRAAAAPGAAAAGTDAVAELPGPRRELVVLLAALGGALVLPEHAAAVAGVPGAAEELEELERRGLVQRQGERFRVLEPLAGAVRARWDGAPSRERALAYFTAWAEQQWNAPAEILEESDVLLLLLEEAVEAGAWPEVLRLGRRVEGALALAGRWDAWKRVVEWLRLASEKAGDRRGVAWALHQLGTLALCAGDTATAQAALTQALRERESLGDREAARVTRHNLDLLAPPVPGRPEREADREAGRVREAVRRSRKPLVAAAVVATLGVGGVVSLLSREPDPPPPQQRQRQEQEEEQQPPLPVVELAPSVLAFGEQAVGSASPPIVVRLTNRGRDGLPIAGVSVSGSDFRIADDGCSGAAALEPGGECSLSVLFTPASSGPRDARIAVTDAAGRTVSDVPVTGSGAPAPVDPSPPPDSAVDTTDPDPRPTPPPPRLRADRRSLAFGAQRVGGAGAERRVRVSNAGGRPARVTGVRLEGGGSFQLAGSGCQGAVLDPGEGCTVTVRFAPASAGPRTAALVLEHAAEGGRVRVALSGEGEEAPRPRSVATAAVSPAEGVDFGEREVGGSPLVRRVTVSSRGSAPLAVGDVTVRGAAAGDFTATAPCAGEEVAPGGSCSVAVRFAPSAAGRRSAELLVRSNDPAGPRLVPLAGVGTTPRIVVEEARADARLSPERLDFGERPVGPIRGGSSLVDALASGGRILTIRSTGGAPLRVSAVRFEGEHAGDFSVGRGPCREPVAPRKSCSFRVNFAPGALGGRRATLVVEDNTAASPRRVALGGTGVNAPPPRDTDAPPAPAPRGLGSPDPGRAPTLCQGEGGRRIPLRWGAVSDPGGRVSYRVVFEEGPTGGAGNPGFLNTTETTVSVPGLFPGRSLRWNVRAVDAAGNESSPSAWLHVTCPATPVIR